jgi:uncharacterized protein (TIGR02301 family)
MLKRFLIVVAFLAALPASAQNIDYAARARDLESLSRIFGTLHHIRRMCEPRSEAEIWRDRMQKLIELEAPQPALRQKMVSAFNGGFRQAERRFEYCDRDARDHAAALATQGDAVTARLLAPLYEALADSGELPTVWRGERN